MEEDMNPMPVKPSLGNWWKLGIILGLFLLVSLLSLWQFALRKNQEVKKERTEEGYVSYTSDKFSFDYPRGWQITIGNRQEPSLPQETINIEDKKGGKILIIPLKEESKEQSLKPLFVKKVLAASPVKIIIESREGEPPVFQNASRGPNVYLEFEVPPGQQEMIISENSNFSGAFWESYSALKPWTFSGEDGEKTIYAKFKDSRGQIIEGSASFLLDRIPPFGGIYINNWVVGRDITILNVSLGAGDNLSGVIEMRVGKKPDFSDTIWEPYSTTKILPWGETYQDMDSKPHGFVGIIYVQYRDLAGNISEGYSGAYQVDRLPPVIYVEVEAAPKTVFRRKVYLYGYDELVDLKTVKITNDPRFNDDVQTLPYEINDPERGAMQIDWIFDERKVVWVKVQDSVGNWTEPYPADAGEEPTPTPQPSANPLITVTPTPSVLPSPPISPALNKEFFIKTQLMERAVKDFWPDFQRELLEKKNINGKETVRAVYYQRNQKGKGRKMILTALGPQGKTYLVAVSSEDPVVLSIYEKIINSFKIRP